LDWGPTFRGPKGIRAALAWRDRLSPRAIVPRNLLGRVVGVSLDIPYNLTGQEKSGRSPSKTFCLQGRAILVATVVFETGGSGRQPRLRSERIRAHGPGGFGDEGTGSRVRGGLTIRPARGGRKNGIVWKFRCVPVLGCVWGRRGPLWAGGLSAIDFVLSSGKAVEQTCGGKAAKHDRPRAKPAQGGALYLKPFRSTPWKIFANIWQSLTPWGSRGARRTLGGVGFGLTREPRGGFSRRAGAPKKPL